MYTTFNVNNALHFEKSIKGKPKKKNDTNHYKTFYPSVGNQKKIVK